MLCVLSVCVCGMWCLLGEILDCDRDVVGFVCMC